MQPPTSEGKAYPILLKIGLRTPKKFLEFCDALISKKFCTQHSYWLKKHLSKKKKKWLEKQNVGGS